MELWELWEYPGSIPSEGSQLVVSYNEAWLPIISGQLAKLASKSIWSDAPSDILSEVNDLVYQLSKPVSIPAFPTSACFFPPQMEIITGSDVEWLTNTSAKLNGFWRRITPALNDEYSVQFSLAAGDYVLEYAHAKSSGSGIVSIGIIELLFMTTSDQYNATTQPNQIFTDTFSVPESQVLTLALKIPQKNASSSGYAQNWQYLAIRKA